MRGMEEKLLKKERGSWVGKKALSGYLISPQREKEVHSFLLADDPAVGRGVEKSRFERIYVKKEIRRKWLNYAAKRRGVHHPKRGESSVSERRPERGILRPLSVELA